MSEIEVLSDIYGDCIQIHSSHKFSMKFLPYIGDEGDKAFLFVQIEFSLPPTYPHSPPTFRIMQQKGLDEDSLHQFSSLLKQKLNEMANEAKTSLDNSGYLYDAMDYILTTLTSINDSIGGNCPICLEEFEEGSKKKFSEREDLCRISGCYHRFHKACLYNYWFVKPLDEIGEYGLVIKHSIKKEKRCPICRIEVDLEEAKRLVEIPL